MLARKIIPRASCPNRDLLLFDDYDSGAFLHVKLNPQLELAYVHPVGKIICMPIGSGFGASVISHSWEVFAQSLCKKAEHLQSSWNLPEIVHKHKALPCIIKRPKDTDKYPHLLVQVTADRIVKGVIIDGKRGPTQNTMISDETIIVETWEQLKPALA